MNSPESSQGAEASFSTRLTDEGKAFLSNLVTERGLVEAGYSKDSVSKWDSVALALNEKFNMNKSGRTVRDSWKHLLSSAKSVSDNKRDTERETAHVRRGNHKDDTLVYDSDNKLDEEASRHARMMEDAVQQVRDSEARKEQKIQLASMETLRKTSGVAAGKVMYLHGKPKDKLPLINKLLNTGNKALIEHEDLSESLGIKPPRYRRRAPRHLDEDEELNEEEEEEGERSGGEDEEEGYLSSRASTPVSAKSSTPVSRKSSRRNVGLTHQDTHDPLDSLVAKLCAASESNVLAVQEATESKRARFAVEQEALVKRLATEQKMLDLEHKAREKVLALEHEAREKEFAREQRDRDEEQDMKERRAALEKLEMQVKEAELKLALKKMEEQQ